jgi:hypothetical protein
MPSASKGTQAIWKNTWIAAGNPMTWDMLHYDVQLIGGVALHKGRSPRWAPVRARHW